MSLQGSVGYYGNPAGWPVAAIRKILSQSKAAGRPDLPLLGVNLQTGVTRRSEDDGRPAASEDLSAYKTVSPGDVVMNRLGKPHGSVGVSRWVGITSPAYWVMSVDRDSADPRFVHHLLRAPHLIREYERLGKYMPPNQFDISWEAFRSIELPLPKLGEQRRIADFLDTEVARIDHAVELRSSQLKLLEERLQSYSSGVAANLIEIYGSVRLRHLIRRIEQGWSPQCEDRLANEGEWGVVKAGCINGGFFDITAHKALPGTLVPRAEYQLKEGDLLVSRASGSVDLIGSVGVVPALRQDLLLCDKIYRITLEPTRALVPFIAHMLRILPNRELIKVGISGADGMANNLPTAVIKDCVIPKAPLDIQNGIAATLTQRSLAVANARKILSQQTKVIAERRQALITAAVTGQIDVSTARGVAAS